MALSLIFSECLLVFSPAFAPTRSTWAGRGSAATENFDLGHGWLPSRSAVARLPPASARSRAHSDSDLGSLSLSPMSDSYLYAAGTSPAHTGQGSGAPLRGSTSYQNGRSFRNATPPAHAHQILMASQSRRLRACGLGTRLWAVLISWSMHGSCPPTTASRKQSTTTTLVVVVRSSFWAQRSSSSPFTRFLGVCRAVLPGRCAPPQPPSPHPAARQRAIFSHPPHPVAARSRRATRCYSGSGYKAKTMAS